MAVDESASFGEQLRRHRLRAGLTQQALAERAAMSLRGLSDLERGARRAPYPDTVRRLADAIGLSEAERTALVASSGRAGLRANAGPATQPLKLLLPMPLSSFVGREREVADVQRLLGTSRLVTLTGPGGIGKTRLAIEAARQLSASYTDGVALADLSALFASELVPEKVAAALGLHEQSGQLCIELLEDVLRSRHLLLLLDSCEHLAGACADLAATLLPMCPAMRILATSRESLGVVGETTFSVPSLSLPQLALQEDNAAPPAQSEAVRLFVERARAAMPSFLHTRRNATVVAEICHRVDGIPLALELAAARVRALGVEQIAQRLDDQLGLLTSGGRTAPPRQQTLRATLDWSYGLLSDHERLLFARLSIFAGGWTLEAAESVCGGDGIEGRQVLDLLAQLVDKSLVTAEVDADESVRYRLLETSRQYGLERLRERSAAEAAQRSHATYFLALAEQAAPELRGASQVRWVERLEAEHDNLRAAQRWCVEHGEAEHGLRFGGALWRFWQLHGHLTEGRERLRQALGLAEAGMPSGPRMAARAAALIGAGALSWHQGEYALARSMYEESLAIFRGLGDRLGVAESLNNLGIVAWRQGEYALARSLYDEGLSIRRDMGDHLGVAASLHNLGNVAGHEGDYVQARSLHEQSLAIFRELGEGLGIVHSLHNLGAVAEHQGEYALARSLHKESLAIARELGNKETIARSVEGFARVAAAHGQAGRALRLAGAAAGLRDTINAAHSPAEQELLEHGLQPAWQRLSAEAGAEAWALGQTMSVEQALAYDEVLAEEPNEDGPDLAT